MWSSSFGNEIPKGLAVPLPALGVWKEEVYTLSWAEIQQGLAGGLLVPVHLP